MQASSRMALAASRRESLPQEFCLKIIRDQIVYKVRLVWLRGDEVGGEFLETGSAVPSDSNISRRSVKHWPPPRGACCGTDVGI
jgi:hypothetical protein